LTPAEDRQQLRIRLIAWALLAGGGAQVIGLAIGLEPGLRSGGSGFFYGLLAFHLQRVDPDYGHLQAGLVGAVCALLSLAMPLDAALGTAPSTPGALTALVLELLRAWLPLWLPLVGGALVLQMMLRLSPGLRP
jgi:hypothetical protein